MINRVSKMPVSHTIWKSWCLIEHFKLAFYGYFGCIDSIKITLHRYLFTCYASKGTWVKWKCWANSHRIFGWFALAKLIEGPMSDRIGRKVPLIIGMITFGDKFNRLCVVTIYRANCVSAYFSGFWCMYWPYAWTCHDLWSIWSNPSSTNAFNTDGNCIDCKVTHGGKSLNSVHGIAFSGCWQVWVSPAGSKNYTSPLKN